METAILIKEIRKLPIIERMFIIENTMKSIREETLSRKNLKDAAKSLLIDYKTDKELTAFTSLDSEPFYETKWHY